jgi:hypothetical protein
MCSINRTLFPKATLTRRSSDYSHPNRSIGGSGGFSEALSTRRRGASTSSCSLGNDRASLAVVGLCTDSRSGFHSIGCGPGGGIDNPLGWRHGVDSGSELTAKAAASSAVAPKDLRREHVPENGVLRNAGSIDALAASLTASLGWGRSRESGPPPIEIW